MSKYTVLTWLGFIIAIAVNVLVWCGIDIPDMVQIICSWVGAILMIIGLYFRSKEKKGK